MVLLGWPLAKILLNRIWTAPPVTRTPVPLLKEITLAPPGSGVPTMTFPTYFDPVEGTGRWGHRSRFL